MSSPADPLIVVILAAGEGTRMKSRRTPKVLHSIAGRTLLGHALAAVAAMQPTITTVVVGHRADEVSSHLHEIAPHAVAVLQAEQRGTGHAVRVALQALQSQPALQSQLVPARGTVLVLPGDAPLLRPETLTELLADHRAHGAAATLLSGRVSDPTGYGRVIRAGDTDQALVAKVVEDRDATAAELEVNEVSALVYTFDAALLTDALSKLSTDNAQGEEYLPEVVSLLMGDGRPVRARLAPADEIAGVNDRSQLAAAHRVLNERILQGHMLAGVTVIDPATTWVDAGVALAEDVNLQPNVQLHGTTQVGEGSTVGPDSTLTDTIVGEDSQLHRVVADRAVVGNGVTVGPFAYLRPGTVLHDGVHVGTYVEIKKSTVGQGTKVPHLTYMGDATVGRHSNIGASTVFVNYDGEAKHPTIVGDHVFIGSDTMLVAPVTVADGGQTAAGSVITDDVPAGALAVARARQHNVEGWVTRKRPDSAGASAARASGAGADTSGTSAHAADAGAAASGARVDTSDIAAGPDEPSTEARHCLPEPDSLTTSSPEPSGRGVER